MNKFRKAFRKSSTAIQPPPSPPLDRLRIAPDQVSGYEKRLYEVQWTELDPFDLGHVDLDTLRGFLQQNISSSLIEQEWDQGEVYALFRLVGHIKQGRQVNADLIYLPVPPDVSLPRNRSFSDPFITLASETNLTRHQRHSIDTASMLLTAPFMPNQQAIYLNLAPNRDHQPPPPVPPQTTKPARLSHLISNRNIFDTPPNYRHYFHHADSFPQQSSFI
ncbi:hypothetical protein BC941DRAFT_471750 [Chlamydoabsidia padenii]|nr:hypothetical protein BC941DRAFT_471750 [Chlamydoabsidia padenii]